MTCSPKTGPVLGKQVMTKLTLGTIETHGAQWYHNTYRVLEHYLRGHMGNPGLILWHAGASIVTSKQNTCDYEREGSDFGTAGLLTYGRRSGTH